MVLRASIRAITRRSRSSPNRAGWSSGWNRTSQLANSLTIGGKVQNQRGKTNKAWLVEGIQSKNRKDERLCQSWTPKKRAGDVSFAGIVAASSFSKRESQTSPRRLSTGSIGWWPGGSLSFGRILNGGDLKFHFNVRTCGSLERMPSSSRRNTRRTYFIIVKSIRPDLRFAVNSMGGWKIVEMDWIVYGSPRKQKIDNGHHAKQWLEETHSAL